MKLAILIAALFSAAAYAQQYDRNAQRGGPDERDRDEDIQLVCFGQAERTVAETHSGYQWNQERNSSPITGV